MANRILHKRTAVAGRVPQPTDLQLGELAVNTTDGRLFLKKSVAGTESIVQLGEVSLSGDVSGTGIGSINVTLANTGVAAGTYASVTVDAKGRVTGGTNTPAITGGTVTGSAINSTPIGATTASTGRFTSLASTGNTTVGGSLTVTGNLIINGTTTTFNSTTVTIDDPVFTLGGDVAPTSDDNKDRGIEFRWHNGSVARIGFFGYDDSTGKFTFIPDATNTGEVFSGTKGTLDANIEFADVLNKPTTLAGYGVGVIPDAHLSGTYTGVNVSGNAGTATKLATARTINGVAFDGTANITVADATKLPLAGGKMTGPLSREFVSGTSGLQTHRNVGVFNLNTSNNVGVLKITLPFGWTSTMLTMKLRGFSYDASGSWELLLGGYNYTTSAAWSTCSASTLGTTAPFTKVRFAHDGTNACILLGELDTVWRYPKVVIEEVMASYSGANLDWSTGWSTGLITDETGITVSQTPMVNAGISASLLDGQTGAYYLNAANLTGTVATARLSGTYGISVTGNAATATKLATARTINGVAFDGTANITVADSTKLPLTGGTLTGRLVASGLAVPLNERVEFNSAATGLGWSITETSADGVLRFQTRTGTGAYGDQVTISTTGGVSASAFTGNGSGLTNLNAANLGSGILPDARLSGTYTGVSITGNAATATKLATARTINGVAFDGTANITVADSTKLPLTGGALTGVLRLTDGTAALPGLAFGADTDTGVYRTGTNGIGITTGGTAAAVFDSAGNTTVYGRLRSAGNLSLSSWTTTGCGLDIAAATFTDTTSADAAVIATRASSTFNTPTFASTNAITVTNAASVFISAPPTAGPNTTLTNRYSLWVNSGASYFGGAITVNGVITGNGSGLTTLNAANLTSGILPDARLSGTYTGVSITGNAATATKLATARTINGVAFDGSANIVVADSTKLPLSGGTLSGDIMVSKANPWLTLNSNTSGANGVEQGAGISIGESGYKAAACLHLTYTGDGYGHIGMGTVDGTTGVMANRAMRFFYTSRDVAFDGQLQLPNTTLLDGTVNGLRITNGANGYVDIGNRNTSYTHYSSSTGQHYFYGDITAQGNVTAYSDVRVKTDLQVIPDALDKVSQLTGYTYERTDIETDRQTGLVAQDVQKVLPEAVTTNLEDGHLSVAYGNMVGLLVEAIKELNAKVDSLTQEVETLRKQNQ